MHAGIPTPPGPGITPGTRHPPDQTPRTRPPRTMHPPRSMHPPPGPGTPREEAHTHTHTHTPYGQTHSCENITFVADGKNPAIRPVLLEFHITPPLAPPPPHTHRFVRKGLCCLSEALADPKGGARDSPPPIQILSLPYANELAERYCFHKCVSRILSTGGCLPDSRQGRLGRHPTWADTRPLPPRRQPLQRTVHILLACILVFMQFSAKKFVK